MSDEKTTLKISKKINNDILSKDEIHPSTESAYDYLNSIPIDLVKKILIILKKNADTGNKIGTVNLYVFERFFKGEELTDLHILGLAWTINAILLELQIEETTRKLTEAMRQSVETVDNKER